MLPGLWSGTNPSIFWSSHWIFLFILPAQLWLIRLGTLMPVLKDYCGDKWKPCIWKSQTWRLQYYRFCHRLTFPLLEEALSSAWNSGTKHEALTWQKMGPRAECLLRSAASCPVMPFCREHVRLKNEISTKHLPHWKKEEARKRTEFL